MSADAADKAGAIAHRPGLEEAMERQRRVLAQLEAPMTRDELRAWKADVVRAGVGRTSPGLRSLLADPEFATLVEPYFLDATPQAGEFRCIMHEALAVEFAYPLEDMSRLASENLPRPGMGEGSLSPSSRHATSFR